MSVSTITPGSLVRIRQRLWRVDGVAEKTLTATPIDGAAEQHRFWLPMERVEAARLAPPAPGEVGRLADHQLLLRAFRLSLLHGSAPILSLQRSRVIPVDFQLVPLIMALEQAERVRLLIADDVGLGKSIEAGLVITELMARQRARRLLVVCPASLREQWRETLNYFFHIDARIISTTHRRALERGMPAGANPWEYFDALIASVDYAKEPAIRNAILEHPWDIVLIDEAHQTAKPHQTTADQKVEMDRNVLARALAEAPQVQHLLLLTATPHNGYTDSFASLLDMLGVDAVSGPLHQPTIHRGVAVKHVVQRRRKDLEDWFGLPEDSPFPKREQKEEIVEPSQAEKQAIAAVEAYGEAILARAARERRGSALTRWVVIHFHKRALSSPDALRASFKNRQERLEQRLAKLVDAETEQQEIAEALVKANVLDADTGERVDSDEASQRTDRAATPSRRESIEAELGELQRALALADKVTPARDAKLKRLLDKVLPDLLSRHPRPILFTRYTDTLHYLHTRISRDKRYKDLPLVIIEGSLAEAARRERFREFERHERALLLATDAISEGLNLQHAASQVIHYELPWNPNRLEQRNGRVDRYGQPEETVHIRVMVMDDTLDATILAVLVRKAEQIRHDRGYAPPYFSSDDTIMELIQARGAHHRLEGGRQLSLFGDGSEGGSKDFADPFADERLATIERDAFYGQTHIRLPEVQARLTETARTLGSPEVIRRFVTSGLRKFGGEISENHDGTFRLELTDPALQVAGLPRVIAKATFDPRKALDDPDLDMLDLGHPLVRRLIEHLKYAAFQPGEHYGRAAALTTSVVSEPTAIFHLVARYVVGTTTPGIVEELLPVAIPIYGGETLPAAEGDRLLQAEPERDTRTPAEIKESLRDALEIEGLGTMLNAEVEARRGSLVTERRAFRERLQSSLEAGQGAWLYGIDELQTGTYDVLAVTICYPVRR